MFIHNKLNKLCSVCVLATLGAMLFFPKFVNATSNKELEKVQLEIKNHQKVIQEKQDDLEALKKQLAIDEKEYNDINKKLNSTKKELTNSQEKLNNLSKKQQLLLLEKDRHLELLSKQIIEAYKLGSSDYLKIILNQEDPNSIGRALEYHTYMNKARMNVIKEIETLIAELAQNKLDIESNNKALNKLIANHNNEAEIVLLKKNKKEKTAETIKLNLFKEQQQLVILKQTENKLLQEIAQNQKRIEEENRRKQREKIEQAKAKANKEGYSAKEAEQKAIEQIRSTELKGLEPLKGKLIWPMKGKVIRHFGDSRAGELTWTGLLIKASNPHVVSIADGNVVMAGPLDGYGVIIVVDHGDGYWSLYGNNKSVIRSVGDRVKKGELLSYYNQSSNQLESALYFEIRHKGQPLNPEKWLQKK